MDKYEFMDKAKFNCTEEEYTKIEFVYLNCPMSCVGSCVTEFCNWFNKNGKMKAVEMVYPMAMEFKARDEKIADMKAEAKKSMEAYIERDVECENMKKKIAFYEKCVTDDMLNLYLADMSREDKIAILSQRF